jgi:hypothetical protein
VGTAALGCPRSAAPPGSLAPDFSLQAPRFPDVLTRRGPLAALVPYCTEVHLRAQSGIFSATIFYSRHRAETVFLSLARNTLGDG